MILKGLPLAYQRDLQEDKPPLFGAIATWEASLGVMAGLITTLAVDRERMRAAAGEGYTTATAVADALVRRGVPFRVAHHIVGSLVAQAEGEGIGLEAMPDAMIGAGAGRGRDDAARALRPRRGSAIRSGPRLGRGRAGDLRRHRRDRPAPRRGGTRGGAGTARRLISTLAGVAWPTHRGLMPGAGGSVPNRAKLGDVARPYEPG